MSGRTWFNILRCFLEKSARKTTQSILRKMMTRLITSRSGLLVALPLITFLIALLSKYMIQEQLACPSAIALLEFFSFKNKQLWVILKEMVLLFSVFATGNRLGFKFYKVPSLCNKLFKLLFLNLTISNRNVCKNYAPKVKYWQFCPTLREQSLADPFSGEKKCLRIFFSRFLKIYNDTTSCIFVTGRPVLMQNTRLCGRTIIWHRFHVGNAPSKIHLS